MKQSGGTHRFCFLLQSFCVLLLAVFLWCSLLVGDLFSPKEILEKEDQNFPTSVRVSDNPSGYIPNIPSGLLHFEQNKKLLQEKPKVDNDLSNMGVMYVNDGVSFSSKKSSHSITIDDVPNDHFNVVEGMTINKILRRNNAESVVSNIPRKQNPDLLEKEKQLEAKQLEAKQLEAKQLEAKQLEAQQLEAQQLEAKQLEAKQLEVKVDKSLDTMEEMYSFKYGNAICRWTLGHCIGIGCDGVVWSGKAYCSNNKTFDVAVKFYKNDTDVINGNQIIDESQLRKRIQEVDPLDGEDYLAYPLSSTSVRAGDLSTTTANCPVVNYTENTQCPGLLPQSIWRDLDHTIEGVIMPLGGIAYEVACEEAEVRQNILPILEGLAKGFQTLKAAKVIHCDIQTVHATVKKSKRTSSYTSSIIDFGRIKICREDENCTLGYIEQMFQFGSLIVDFCRPEGAQILNYQGAAYAYNGGPCEWIANMRYSDEDLIRKNFREAWDTEMRPRIALGLAVCPHHAFLEELVLMAYSPMLHYTHVEWDEILTKLRDMIHSTNEVQGNTTQTVEVVI